MQEDLFCSAVALKSCKAMIVERKLGKLPGEILTREYDLEFRKISLSRQSNTLKKFNFFVFVDDLQLIARRFNCISRLLKVQRKEILGLNAIIEFKKLKGRSKCDVSILSMK